MELCMPPSRVILRGQESKYVRIFGSHNLLAVSFTFVFTVRGSPRNMNEPMEGGVSQAAQSRPPPNTVQDACADRR